SHVPGLNTSLAMTWRHQFSSSRAVAPSHAGRFALDNARAQGRPDAWPAPMARVQQKKHAAVTTGTAWKHPAFPARWF
ncbi:hypothetical protein, partial [Bradyrhizobium denitrificans]|uniref:hypothetical protein n=1 Tax=Bradyrhizobium denitrificans TaxID=2734912 RepID=UPI001AEDF37D